MDLKQQLTLLNLFDKKYLIDCLDKHGYILKVKRILNNPIDPKLLCKYLVESPLKKGLPGNANSSLIIVARAAPDNAVHILKKK